jgi:uncharacterized paraquat-inducible protein A
MALINCPECKQQISDNAPTCPHCGYSMHAVTIEQTGKTWKLLIIMSILMFLVGLALMPNKNNESFAWILITFGVIFFFVGKIGRWWNNR